MTAKASGGSCDRPVSGLARGSRKPPDSDAPPSRAVRARHIHDVTLRPSGWLFRGGKASVHLHSPTVAGAVGELRLAPRTPFPFHPSATLNGHLLLRSGRPESMRFRTNRYYRHSLETTPIPFKGGNSTNDKNQDNSSGKDAVASFDGAGVRNKQSQESIPDGRLHPTPGHSKPRFWAGLLTRLHPSLETFPCEHSGIVQSRQAYSSGGCAGISFDADRQGVTGFPFHHAPQLQSMAPKTRCILASPCAY